VDTFDTADELFGGFMDGKFGSSIAMSSNGRRVVVGSSHQERSTDPYAGRVDVYDYKGAALATSVHGAVLYGENRRESFGEAIAISGSGTRLAVAVPYTRLGGTGQGEVRIYDLMDSTNSWNKTATIPIDIETGLTDNHLNSFQLQISENGKKLLVASLYDGAFGEPVGSVRTYTLVGSGWKKVGRLSGKGANHFFGFSIAMVSDGSRYVHWMTRGLSHSNLKLVADNRW